MWRAAFPRPLRAGCRRHRAEGAEIAVTLIDGPPSSGRAGDPAGRRRGRKLTARQGAARPRRCSPPRALPGWRAGGRGARGNRRPEHLDATSRERTIQFVRRQPWRRIGEEGEVVDPADVARVDVHAVQRALPRTRRSNAARRGRRLQFPCGSGGAGMPCRATSQSSLATVSRGVTTTTRSKHPMKMLRRGIDAVGMVHVEDHGGSRLAGRPGGSRRSSPRAGPVPALPARIRAGSSRGSACANRSPGRRCPDRQPRTSSAEAVMPSSIRTPARRAAECW